jgi:hypothetical protein
MRSPEFFPAPPAKIVDARLRQGFGAASPLLRQGFGAASPLLRQGFGAASPLLRQGFGAASRCASRGIFVLLWGFLTHEVF